MRTRLYLFIFLTGGLMLQGYQLSAQEYLDLWRNGKTDNFYLIQQKFNEYFANRDKGRGSGYKQFKRWEEFMEPRVYPSGKLINPAKLALDEELRYRGRTGNTLSRTAHTGDWQSLGITGYQTTTGWGGGMGRVNCIVPHPGDPNTLYVGTPAGGIWKTANNGATWTSLSDGLPIIGVSGIAINPVHADSIYILTGDGDGAYTFSTGVLLSTNGGDTWQSTGLQWDVDAKTRGYKLLMHPINRSILFAVTSTGIYKTSNGGVSWDLKQSGSFTDLAFKTGNPSILYAVTSTTFYTSFDTGESWAATATGLPSSPNSNRIAIGVTPLSGDYVYLVFGSSTGFLGLYRSTDGGQSFALRSNSPNILGYKVEEPFDQISQSNYDLAIAVSPESVHEVHIGGINCWKSTDGGLSWQPTSFWNQKDAPAGKYTHADIHALVFIGYPYPTLYCASDGGIYSSFSGTNWTDISSGLEITQFYGISSPSHHALMIYGGAQDNGLNKWIFPGTTMDHQLGGDVIKCLVDYDFNDTVYALSPEGKTLYVTEDGGASEWHQALGKSGGGWVVPLIMHPADHTRVYAGYDQVYLITSLGQVFTPVPESASYQGQPYVALGMSADNPSSMYAATAGSLRWADDVTPPESPLWYSITAGLPVSAAQITDVAVSQSNASKAWVSFSGYSSTNKVYKTSDAGDTWTNITDDLPNVPVNCIAYDNNGQDGIYIGTDIGVFYRDNTMTATGWMPFRNGMPNVIVKDLDINNGKIRAATFGRGIWESDLYGQCEDLYIVTGDVTGYQYFESSDAIISTANIKGGIGTQVQYRAANQINLKPGFRVVAQSGLKASIGVCYGTSASQNRYAGAYEGVMPGALGIATIPDNVSLPANRLKVYPNPFSRQSSIEFYLAKPTPVTISLWDLSGKKIKVLFESASQSPGNYHIRLNAAGLRNGGYLVRLQAQDYQETKKIIITQ